jgi:hypothetical protein
VFLEFLRREGRMEASLPFSPLSQVTSICHSSLLRQMEEKRRTESGIRRTSSPKVIFFIFSELFSFQS